MATETAKEVRTRPTQEEIEHLTMRLVAAWEVMGHGYSAEQVLTIFGWTPENTHDTHRAVLLLGEADEFDNNRFDNIVREVWPSLGRRRA